MLGAIWSWLWRMPVSTIMAIVGRVLAPILPFFVQKNGYLPKWLWWFQTPDNPCDGDSGHLERWGTETDFIHTYLRRTAWFLRNVCYGFDINVLGFSVDTTSQMCSTEGNTEASDCNGISGSVKYVCYEYDTVKAFQYYYVKHYTIFGKYSACIRMNIGWKLWNFYNPDKGYAQYVGVYLNPWKKFRKVETKE